MDPQDDDNHPLNPGGIMEVARLPLNPGGGSQDRGVDMDITKSSDPPSYRVEASWRDTSQGVEQAALISSDPPSDRAEASRRDPSHDVELADIPRREPNDDSRSYSSGGGSSTISEDSEKTEKCFPKHCQCLIVFRVKLRIWFQAFLNFCKPVIDFCTKVGKFVAKWGPMIMTVIGISLLSFDQYTDVTTAETICGMPCTCIWNKNPENISTVLFQKNKGICEGTGDSKEGRRCYDAFGNEDLIGRFCNPVENVTLCNKLDTWNSNGWRHPKYCSTTIATIAGSSFLTSSFLLHRVRQLYVSMLTYLGWTQKDHSGLFKALYIIIHVLWILQILPHAWIVMTFFICFKAWRREREIIRAEGKKHWEEADEKEEWEDKELWDESNRRSKIMFAIFEDTPQLTLHSMFIVNSAVKEERVLVFSGLDFLGGWFYVGAITSAGSMAIAVTLYKQLPGFKDKAIQFTSSVLAVGCRAFICACYASTISEDFAFQTWTLMLPPATSFVLFIIDKLATSLYRGDTRKWNINKHADSFYKWVKLPTWDNFKRMMDKIFETVTSAVVSLIFEGNSVESLIPAYTYLGYAVVLNTMWVSESENSERTKILLLVIQSMALVSVLFNLIIVQLEGKHKVRCLVYSLLFLLFLCLFYHYVGVEFGTIKKLYFTDKAVENIARPRLTKLKDETLLSLTPMLCIAGITLSLNLLLKIVSLIRDCFIRALIPDTKSRRDSGQKGNSDIEMEALHS